MKNFYSLVLLIFGAFAVTTTFASDSMIHPQFESYRLIIDHLSTLTFNTFKDLQEKIEFFWESEKNNLKVEEKIQEKVLLLDCKEVIDGAKKNGKNAEKIQSCVNTAQEMYLIDLMMNYKKILKCMNNATEIAKEKVKHAKKVFQSNAFESPIRAVQIELALRRCSNPYNESCIKQKDAEYQKRIEVTSTESKKAIQSSKVAYEVHHTAMKNCLDEKQKIFEIQKNNSEILTQCINNA